MRLIASSIWKGVRVTGKLLSAEFFSFQKSRSVREHSQRSMGWSLRHSSRSYRLVFRRSWHTSFIMDIMWGLTFKSCPIKSRRHNMGSFTICLRRNKDRILPHHCFAMARCIPRHSVGHGHNKWLSETLADGLVCHCSTYLPGGKITLSVRAGK